MVKMLKMDDLRRQHDAADEMAATVIDKMAAYRDEYDAASIALLIRKLAALLRLHFAYEDSMLYRTMIRSRDPAAACLAAEFRDEMGSLAEDFEDFARRWGTPDAIADSFADFKEEASAVLAALGSRIERENDQLYPLADRLRARAA
jgi:hemerythrin-like domain-containing protein